MNPIAIGLSAASLLWTGATIVVYFSTIPAGKVPAKVTPLVMKLLVGMALAAAAIIWAQQHDALGAAVIAPASVSAGFAGFVLWLLTQRKTPVGEIKVSVGQSILPFAATTSQGAAFHTDDLSGTRTLLKFFRGGW